MKLFTVPRMRRAVTYSVIFHVVGCLAFVVGTPWKRRPIPFMTEIPIHLVSFSPPPSRLPAAEPPVGNREPAEPEPEPPKEQPKPKQPDEKREVRPVPVPDPPAGEPDSKPADSAVADADPDTMSGLGGTVALAGGGEGELVGVDGPISAYGYYLTIVRDKIARYWVPPAGLVSEGHEIASIVNFRIDRRGKISGSYIEEPSGTSVFDQAGLRAVAQADPLPPLPQDYEEDWLGIQLRFVYRN